MIDANLNRAREALRVLEDTARFVFENSELAFSLKTIRHALAQLFLPLGDAMIRARDVGRDVARNDRRPRPASDLPGLVAANFKRAQEALRSLEEAATIVRSSLHAPIMKLRFDVYRLESRFNGLAPLRLGSARLYVILDPSLCRASPLAVCRKILKGGADIIQLRALSWPDAKLYRLGRALRSEISGALFIINDRPHVAAAVGADGVHLGRSDLPVPAARKILGPRAVIGATTHSAAEARAALRHGADYLSYGPVFATPTKPGLRPAGFSYFSEIKSLGVPFFPIGGINARNVTSLVRRGVRRAAVCSAVLSAADPEKAARSIKRRLSTWRSP
jgi:thiamine-phosphate pyrophosphorylase